MTPEAFCDHIQNELAIETSDDAWVRGARGLCDMYRGTDAQRFEGILTQMAGGRTGSAFADGARWLLQRWQVAVKRQ